MALIIVILINAFKHICEIHEEKLVASSGIEPESGASETLILSPSERRSAGRALYYEFIIFFKYLLPAEDLKYFSLDIASASVSNFS